MNMSYCRFQNTLQDLRDCQTALADNGPDDLSPEERRAAKRLIELCCEVVRTAGACGWNDDDE